MKIYRNIIGFEFEMIPVFHDSFVFAKNESEAAFLYGFIFGFKEVNLTKTNETIEEAFDLINQNIINQSN